jgi:hypothetical protein
VSDSPSSDVSAFDFRLGGVTVVCEFERELLGIVPSFVQPTAPAGAGGTSTLHVSARRGEPTSPSTRGLALTCGFGGSEGYTAPGRLELWDGSSLVIADLGGQSVQAVVGLASDPHFVGAVMLFAATALAFRGHGLFHLHAGCVVVPELGTLLIVGESGSGKTTLSVGLAALGGHLVTDDAVFLDAGSTGIEVWGWPADLHVAPGTLRAFPELGPHAIRPISDGRDKRAVPLSALVQPWLPSANRPRVVLFPRVGDGRRSRAKRLAPAEVVAQLIPQSGMAVIAGAARSVEHLGLLAAMADDAVGLEIALGSDALPPGASFLELLRTAMR